MSKKVRNPFAAAFVFILCGVATSINAQNASMGKKGSPELVSLLTKELSITPEQAAGGAGSIFNVAKMKLKPADFAKISKVVPGMDGLLKAAPKQVDAGAADPISSMAGMIPGGMGGVAPLLGSFKSLGLSPEMVGKFLPVLSKYVEGKGGANVAGLLGGVFK